MGKLFLSPKGGQLTKKKRCSGWGGKEGKKHQGCRGEGKKPRKYRTFLPWFPKAGLVRVEKHGRGRLMLTEHVYERGNREGQGGGEHAPEIENEHNIKDHRNVRLPSWTKNEEKWVLDGSQ